MKFKNKKINFETLIFSIITFCAIIVRILWIYLVPNDPVSDFLTYQNIATSIFQGKGCLYMGKPTAFQSMGYPLFLGCFYKLIGSNSVIYAKLLNVIISSATLLTMYFIIKRCFSNKKLRIAAYILIAFLPSYIAYNNVLASETLMVFIFSIIILIQLTMKDNTKWYILLGIFIGIESIIKPYFMVYSILAAIAMYISKKNIKQSVKCLVVSLITTAIVIVPWTYRNYRNFNRIIPVSYNSGYVLFINNNSNNKNGAWMPIRDIKVSNTVKNEFYQKGFKYGVPQHEEMKSVIQNPALEPIFKKEAVKWILNNKKNFLALGIKRIRNTFFSGCYDINNWCYNTKSYSSVIKMLSNNYKFSIILKDIIILLSSMALIFSIYVFFIKRNKAYMESILSINVLFFFFMYFIYEGQPRYNYPLLFIFILILITIISRFFSKKHL